MAQFMIFQHGFNLLGIADSLCLVLMLKGVIEQCSFSADKKPFLYFQSICWYCPVAEIIILKNTNFAIFWSSHAADTQVSVHFGQAGVIVQIDSIEEDLTVGIYLHSVFPVSVPEMLYRTGIISLGLCTEVMS